MAHVSDVGVWELNGQPPPFPPGTSGTLRGKAVVVHLDQNNPVNATIILTVDGQEIARRTVFVEYPGDGYVLEGQVNTGQADLNCCMEVVSQS